MKKPSRQVHKELPEVIDEKAQRKLRAQQERQRPIYFGLGMIGLVGWSVAVPSVIGALLGRWLDAHRIGQGKISWTLTCFFAGLIIGLVVAWQWVNKEGGKR